jgi:hypothetical protein
LPKQSKLISIELARADELLNVVHGVNKDAEQHARSRVACQERCIRAVSCQLRAIGSYASREAPAKLLLEVIAT